MDKERRDKRSTSSGPFPYSRMLNKADALDRLDLRFRWGDYGVRVLRCHLTAFQPGQVVPFHKHSEFEFHFIPKGKGKVIIENQSYELHEGLFYVTGPEVVHYQEADTEEPMVELCLHCELIPLPPAQEDEQWGGERECKEAGECVSALANAAKQPAVDRYNAMNYFLEAYRTWEEQTPGFYTLMKQAIVQILLRTARAFEEWDAPSDLPERDMNFHRYQLATQYIRDNEGMPLTLEQVAESVGISPRQLQRIFRTEGNTTFSDHVEHTRLSLICSELLHTDRSIEEIALNHGFSNPNYLYPVFKKQFGVTPSAYRKVTAGRADKCELDIVAK